MLLKPVPGDGCKYPALPLPVSLTLITEEKVVTVPEKLLEKNKPHPPDFTQPKG